MSFSIRSFLDEINSEFSPVSFEYSSLNFGSTIPVFFVKMENENQLLSKWSDISKYIAINFQSTLSNEFSIWNIYIFFMIRNGISNELKYRIENDTFSSRKIIINSHEDNDKIIKDHILNSDLTIGKSKINELEFHPRLEIWNVIKDKNPMKRTTPEVRDNLEKIIQNIKDGINEIKEG